MQETGDEEERGRRAIWMAGQDEDYKSMSKLLAVGVPSYRDLLMMLLINVEDLDKKLVAAVLKAGAVPTPDMVADAHESGRDDIADLLTSALP